MYLKGVDIGTLENAHGMLPNSYIHITVTCITVTWREAVMGTTTETGRLGVQNPEQDMLVC